MRSSKHAELLFTPQVPVASLVDYYTIMGLINELNTINYNNFVSF